MIDDIKGGLRNAIDRGASLEVAVKSFINAGYSEKEVNQAAQDLQSGGLLASNPQEPDKKMPQSLPKQVPIEKKLEVPEKKPVQQLPQLQPIQQPQKPKPFIQDQSNFPKPKRNIPWLLVTLISVLAILIGLLIVSLIFQEEIVLFLKQYLS